MVRLLDIIFSSLALVTLSPLLIVIASILRLTGEKYVFFKQERVGLKGKHFKVWKFATMLKNSPSLGTGTITIENDPRILPAGHFLRKTKLNELPQLLNVMNGTMSLIGPRPLTKDAMSQYGVHALNEIQKLQPGLSGVGSIVFRNEEVILSAQNNPKDFHQNVIGPYKAKLELWYTQHNNTSTYLMLIILTLHAVFYPKSKIIWSVFKDIPKPPLALEQYF